MFCINCGSAINEGATFCYSCGKSLETQTQKKQPNIPTKNIIIAVVLSAVLLVGIKVLPSKGGAPRTNSTPSQQQSVQCPPCNGVGSTRCGGCSGTGYRLGDWDTRIGASSQHPCGTCNSTGSIPCTYCGAQVGGKQTTIKNKSKKLTF